MTVAFILAGEASGDALGAALIAGLKSLDPDMEFQGVAGPLMQSQGMNSLFPMEELSVMGLAEILPKYRHLKRRIRETAEAISKLDPDVVITIDSPDFSLRVARLVKERSPHLRIVHYVAPSVWAWRPGRAAKMAPIVDQVLALLPFEPPLMEAAGMRCDFVGHPVVTEKQATSAEAEALRKVLGIDSCAPLVLALPGSRKGEVARLSPVFGEALGMLVAKMPDVRVVVPAAPSVAELVKDEISRWPVKAMLLHDPTLSIDEANHQKRTAFRAADVALAASGTVSLELAAAETPMVIGYKMAWLTMQIMQRMAITDSVTLVNLVSDMRVVPEFLGSECRPELLANALEETLKAPEPQVKAARLTMERLGEGGEDPGIRAARAVLDGLK